MNPVQKVRLLLLIILGLVAAGTAGYMFVEGWPFLDSLYMTVITLATVGYGEVRELSRMGELFTILLILLGVGTVSFTALTIAQYLLEGQVRSILGRRQLERLIKGLHDHYIICGFGRMGSALARQLSEKGLPILIIEKDDRRLQRLANTDHAFINGDATTEGALDEAMVQRAKGLVTTVASDAENLFITLTAREMNPSLFIVARAFDESSESKLRRAGANRVVIPTSIGAQAGGRGADGARQLPREPRTAARGSARAFGKCAPRLFLARHRDPKSDGRDRACDEAYRRLDGLQSAVR